MDTLSHARSLLRAGRFLDATRVLNEARTTGTQARATQLIRAHALERLGQHAECLLLLHGLTRSGGPTESERATCEYVLARVRIEEGRIDEAIQHLQRSIGFAKTANDLEQLAW